MAETEGDLSTLGEELASTARALAGELIKKHPDPDKVSRLERRATELRRQVLARTPPWEPDLAHGSRRLTIRD